MKRRTFVRTAGAGAAALGLAGCVGTPTGSASGTLTVATYSAFVDAPSTSPGAWVKEQFEAQYDDVTLEWTTPEQGPNYFVQRAKQGVEFDADVYLGLNVDDLIRIDEELSGDARLLADLDTGGLANYGHVLDSLKFDPQSRAIPYDTGYISLVYNGYEVDDPGTFERLADEYADQLIAQNAQSSDPGRAFLLWTIKNYGPDGYLDYWRRLSENGIRITGSWSDAYSAWSNGDRPIVVSYSTDQVYANQNDADLKKHQIGFLNDQGYANPEGMAILEGTDNRTLAEEFVDWMLSKEAQSEIAVRNVQFPATDWAELSEEYDKYALAPPEPVTFAYDELQGNLSTWVEDWAQAIAGK